MKMFINTMQKIADTIMKFLPEDFGFIVLVFPRKDSGMANYASTEEKEDVIKMLKNITDGLEQNRDFETPENNMY